MGKTWVAQERILNGTLIYRLENCIPRTQPDFRTVQNGPDSHFFESTLMYLNHSCDPNAFLDTATLCLFAIRDIPAGEAITFFYPSTEWDMDKPFSCSCGSPLCLGTICGAKYLTDEHRRIYRFNAHIRDLLRLESGPSD